MMNRILLFAGTSEGRRLAERLSAAGVEAVVCVATEYGKEILPDLPGLTIREGRLDEAEMEQLMRSERFCAVVDATHPFATIVSENIRSAAEAAELPYLRLKRDTSYGGALEHRACSAPRVKVFASHEECASFLMGQEGNVLLTTGSKELAPYCEEDALRDRIYARILANAASLSAAEEAGLPGRQLIAMQGPFTEEMNAALIGQIDARFLVTKETGAAGGFFEKLLAAERTGATLCVIGNPETAPGLSFGEICEKLSVMLGVELGGEGFLDLTLVGMGMGSAQGMTAESLAAIRGADVLFGAARLVEDLQGLVYPYYRSEDIFPILREKWEEARLSGAEALRAVVLFSGDSGFYSGCEGFLKACKDLTIPKQVRVLPGISCVSALAAHCGVNWQDASIVSLHGKGDAAEWTAELFDAVRHHARTFVLLSGSRNVRELGEALEKLERYLTEERTKELAANEMVGSADAAGSERRGKQLLRVTLGYRLSYPDEEISRMTPAECARVQKEGLYTALVENRFVTPRRLAPAYRDEAFLRGKVPMTKEWVRHAIVSALRLTETGPKGKRTVVYDVGAGTGSVTVEIAAQSAKLRVYAIEHRAEAALLIRENVAKFAAANVSVVPGEAPECFADLPAPTHVFLGGTDGKMQEILAAIAAKADGKAVRVVVTAVSLETLTELASLANARDGIMRTVAPVDVGGSAYRTVDRDATPDGVREMTVGTYRVSDFEMVQLQVSHVNPVGAHHLLQAENPVYLCSFTVKGMY